MPRMRRRNPLQKPRTSTAVNYIIDENLGVFYCVVYDARLAEALSYRNQSLEPALLGAISVSANPRYDDAFCMVDFATARQGYGPLVYDLTARGLEKYVKGCKSLRPSDSQSPLAQAFWAKLDAEELFPLEDDFFRAKYRLKASDMEKNGRKMARGRKLIGFNVELRDAADRMFSTWIGVGAFDKVRPVPLSRMLAMAGYMQ